jgi:excisionase family DNA binding protein
MRANRSEVRMNTVNRVNRETASPVLSSRAAADYLGIGLRTIRTLTEAGKLPCVRLSPRRIGYLRDDLDAYLQRQRRHGDER